MLTQEFVLIPKSVYTSEQPQIAKIIDDRDWANKGAYLSIIQRNKSFRQQSAPQTIEGTTMASPHPPVKETVMAATPAVQESQ